MLLLFILIIASFTKSAAFVHHFPSRNMATNLNNLGLRNSPNSRLHYKNDKTPPAPPETEKTDYDIGLIKESQIELSSTVAGSIIGFILLGSFIRFNLFGSTAFILLTHYLGIMFIVRAFDVNQSS